MLLATTALILLSTCALHHTAVEGATLPLGRTDGRQRLCPPPLRTLPDLNAIHGDTRTVMPNRQFLREWCPPESPVVFPPYPRTTTTTVWGRDVANRFGGPNRTNPHHGAAVEGGSIRITFPGQHITDTSFPASPPSTNNSSEEQDVVEFINSKMHPSLLRPRGHRPVPARLLTGRVWPSGGSMGMVTGRRERL